jgi:hypothetical protein
MANDDRLNTDVLLEAFTVSGTLRPLVSSSELTVTTGLSLPSVKRALSKLVSDGLIEVVGRARATRYRLRTPDDAVVTEEVATPWPSEETQVSIRPQWRVESLKLRQEVTQPLGARYRLGMKETQAWIDEGRSGQSL